MDEVEILKLVEGVVIIDETLMRQTPFFDLYKADRTKEKDKFQEAITFLYFMYSRKSIYIRRMPMQRQVAVLVDIMRKDKTYFDNKISKYAYFKEAKEFYSLDQMSEEEWAYEEWKSDVEDYIKYLKSIPYVIKTRKKEDNVLVEHEIDNSATKMAAVKHFGDLIDLGRKMKERITEKKKTKSQGKREKKLFEDPPKNVSSVKDNRS